MSHPFEVGSEHISDCRFRIADLRDWDNQFGDPEGSHKAVRSTSNSPLPKLATYAAGHGDHSTTAAFVNFCRREPSRCLPCTVYRGFRVKAWIVLEETDETPFWLELLVDSGVAQSDKTIPLMKEANELVSMFVASLRTAKGVKSAI